MSEFRAPTGEWRPIVTIDVVLLTILDGAINVAVLRREAEPYAGHIALPGGYLRPEEDRDIDAAALRILHDKAGLPPLHIEQLKVFSGVGRDPRGWSLSCAFLALLPHDALPADHPLFELRPVNAILEEGQIAFDHADILREAMARLRGKGGYSTLPTAFVGREFALSQLHEAYEVALGRKINRTNFRRKILAQNVLEEVGVQSVMKDRSRPAEIFRLRDGYQTFERSLSGIDS